MMSSLSAFRGAGGAAMALSKPIQGALLNTTRQMSQKHKTPWKRASGLLHLLRNEEFEKLKVNKDVPQFRAGDSIQIDHLPNMSSNDPAKLRGIVIAKTNREMDSAVTILNSEQGTPVERRINIYSPLVTNITVLERAALHKGKKRVRRSKLYYLRDRKPDLYTVAYESAQKKKVAKKGRR